MPVRRHLRLMATGVVLAGCLATAAQAAPAALTGGSGPQTTCAPGTVVPLRSERIAYAAIVLRPLAARRSLASRSATRFDRKNANGATTVFGVLAKRLDGSCRVTHYRVQLPVRPNGSTGWVRAADVRLREVSTRLEVDLSQRRITLYRDGRPLMIVSAVTGAPSTPTPTGHFYVNQRLLSTNALGAYGPGAVGISAFSPVLVNWPQGGPIAIHGTNAPQMIGFAVSHGCLRVRNADITRLLRLAVEGTPVVIRK